MWKIYLFIWSLASSLNLIENFEDIYLIDGEYLEISLSQYFEGNNLTYSLSDSNSKSELTSKFDLQLASFIPNLNQTQKSKAKQFPMWKENSEEIIVDFFESEIIIYKFSLISKNYTVAYKCKIETQYKNEYIEDIKVVHYSGNLYYLLIYVKQQEYFDEKLIWRNDFYVLNATIPISGHPIWINLSEIAYSSKIILDTGSWSTILVIYYEIGDNRTLSIYSTKDVYNPVLLQKINSYKLSPYKNIEILDLLVRDNAVICVIDANAGIIFYKKIGNTSFWYKEEGIISLEYISPFNSSSWLYHSHEYRHIYANTKNGIFIVENPNQTINMLPNIEIGGKLFTFHIIYCVSKYFITQSSSILSIISDISPKYRLSDIDLKEKIRKDFDMHGTVGIFEDISFKNIYYVRKDKDGIRIFLLVIEEWKLKIWGNSSYSISITATELSPKLSTLSADLNVISIPENTKEIYYLNKYKSSPVVPIHHSLYKYGSNSSFTLYPNIYFSGQNLNFIIKEGYVDYYLTIQTSPIEKLHFLETKIIPSSVKYIDTDNGWEIYFWDDSIFMTNNNMENYIDNIENPKSIFPLHRCWIIYCELSIKNYIMLAVDEELEIIDKFTSDIECLFMKSSSNHFICANSNQIDLFYYDYTNIKKLFTFDASLVNTKPWNITDIAFSSYKYIYVLNQGNEIIFISISDFYINDPKYYIDFLKLSKIYQKILAGDYFVYLINQEGFDVYNYPLSFLKTLKTVISGNTVRAYTGYALLYLQIDDYLLIYDNSQPFLNSLFFSKKLEKGSKISVDTHNSPNYIYIYYEKEGQKVFDLYAVACEHWSYTVNSCEIASKIYITSAQPHLLTESEYSTSLSIITYNDFDIKKIDIPLIINSNGFYPRFKSTIWQIPYEIGYDKSFEIDLSQVFFGQNLNFSLVVNENDKNKSNKMIFPAEVPKRIEQISEYYTKDGSIVYDYMMIPNTNFSMISSDNGFIVINSENNMDLWNIKIDEYTKYQNPICKHMDNFKFSKNGQLLVVASCIYTIEEKLPLTKPITDTFSLHSLIIFDFDIFSFKISKFNELPIDYDVFHLKLATINDSLFEIMVLFQTFHDLATLDNKKLLRVRGNWDLKEITITIIEKITFFTLNLESFLPHLMDVKVKNEDQVYWYFGENHLYIKILETSHKIKSKIVKNIKIVDQLDYIGAISICGDFLFVIENDSLLKKYLIKDFTELILDASYNSYGSESLYFIAGISELTCSDNLQYIVSFLHMSNQNNYIRVWDLKANKVSTIISNVYISTVSGKTYFGRVTFLDANTFTVLESINNNFKTFRINKNVLIIRKMSKNQYFSMIDAWGSNIFNISLTVNNENGSINSTVLTMKRQGPIDDSNNFWWIFILVLFAILIIAIMLACLYKKLKKNRDSKHPITKSILMKEMKIYDKS